MSTVRFQLTFMVTYNVNVEHLETFYGTKDLQEALDIDLFEYTSDPSLLFEVGHDVVVSGKILNEE
jgi:hypothetical protein